jgi:hypothetical protein
MANMADLLVDDEIGSLKAMGTYENGVRLTAR